jgi:hypothetical protein
VITKLLIGSTEEIHTTLKNANIIINYVRFEVESHSLFYGIMPALA